MWFKVKKTEPMAYSDDVIRQHALRHLAEVFRLPETALTNDARFGQELKAAPPSDFKPNEFDLIDDDIKDVADKRLLKEMAQGLLVIQTVGDYCEHMIRCSALKPQAVARILRLPATQ